jgi:hypothetical protein
MIDSIIKEISGTKIKVRNAVGGYKEFDILELFKIDDTNLSKEMSQQAAIYGYFSVLAAMADDVSSKASFEASTDEAVADLNYRDKYAKTGQKFTEATIRATIMSDEKHIKKLEVELVTKYDLKLLKAIVATLDQRANMLVSLGAWLRHELDMTSMHTNESKLTESVDAVKTVMSERKARKLAHQ